MATLTTLDAAFKMKREDSKSILARIFTRDILTTPTEKMAQDATVFQPGGHDKRLSGIRCTIHIELRSFFRKNYGRIFDNAEKGILVLFPVYYIVDPLRGTFQPSYCFVVCRQTSVVVTFFSGSRRACCNRYFMGPHCICTRTDELGSKVCARSVDIPHAARTRCFDRG